MYPQYFLFKTVSTTPFDYFQLMNGQVVYISQIGTSALVNMTIADMSVADGDWHNITLESQNRGLRLIVDGSRVGEELDSAGVHDFLDPDLTYFSVGGYKREPSFNREFYLHSKEFIHSFNSFPTCGTNLAVVGKGFMNAKR